MDARRLLVALLLVALVAPAAQAHTAIFSQDARVRGSVGLLNEPVSTYAVTGLDVCFTENTPTPRAAVNVTQPDQLTAVLRAPSGAQHAAAVDVPFGRPNCVTFETPLVLTEPGQYLVDLSGQINGSSFSAQGVLAGGVVEARENITFPATGLSTYTDLQARITDLESRLAVLQQDLEARGEESADGGRFAPATPVALLLVALAALAMLRRVR